MFSTGQIYFSLFFVIVFITSMYLVYKKDMSIHKTHYKGSSKWVFLGFMSFLAILLILKYFLKNN